jgi:hypothetical protein
MPTVRLVTPTDKTNNASIKALGDELNNLGWGNNIIQPYSVVDYGDLPTAAQAAVTAYSAGDVIVTAGVMTTNIVLNIPGTSTIPIVQAVGGDHPTIPGGQTNVTGFVINSQATALTHLSLLNSPVAVLYDNTGPSTTLPNTIYAALQVAATAADKTLRPVPASTPSGHTLPAGVNGFMLIPNAAYFKHCGDVVKIVDGKKKADNTTALQIYYPEREYKNAHTNKASVTVLGHNVSLTYSLAAQYVNNILTGYWSVAQGNLPQVQEGVQDYF